MMWVLNDIRRRRQQTFTLFQSDQFLFLQQQKRAAQISRIVRDRHRRAVFQLTDSFDFFRITGHREHKRITDGDEIVAMRFIVLIEERAMLENVGIQLTVLRGVVRQQ